jgi:hypothetical protein
MTTYEKAREIADRLTDILRMVPPSPDIPRRTLLPAELMKRAGKDEINFYYYKIIGE